MENNSQFTVENIERVSIYGFHYMFTSQFRNYRQFNYF